MGCSFQNIHNNLNFSGTIQSHSFNHNSHARRMEQNKGSIVTRLQGVKHKSGKSYNQLAEETGLTNVYVAQLLRRQAQLKPDTAPILRAALPDLPDELVLEMMRPPLRSYDPNLIQDPTVYRSHLLKPQTPTISSFFKKKKYYYYFFSYSLCKKIGFLDVKLWCKHACVVWGEWGMSLDYNHDQLITFCFSIFCQSREVLYNVSTHD